MITEVHQKGRFYRLSTGRAAHYENLKPHVPSPEDWCIPKDMEGLEYLLVEPACEVNERGTREKNDGNENLSLDDNEKIEEKLTLKRNLLRKKTGTIRSKVRCRSGQTRLINTSGDKEWQSQTNKHEVQQVRGRFPD